MDGFVFPHFSPLEKQDEPIHLSQIKNEIRNKWPNTNLLDVLKEADFLTNFKKHFRTTADREILDSFLYSRSKV